MAHEKLYLNDSLLLQFEAKVTAIRSWKGKPSLLLDRSAFYGEAGGQPGDKGWLKSDAEYEVSDVQIDEDGEYHHILAGNAEGLVVGQSLIGSVDEWRRRDSMSQHTGQHLLSAAVFRVAGAETVSSRLGSKLDTLDLDRELSPEQVREAELLVNRLVLEDRQIHRHYPDREQLRGYQLRKQPVVETHIRLIEVEGFDLTPCGGTHCERTGQIGAVRVLGKENYKNLFRLNFLCGLRVFNHSQESDELLKQLNASFGCHPSEIPQVANKLREELRQSRDELGKVRAELIRGRAEAIWAAYPKSATGVTAVPLVLEHVDLAGLRAYAKTLCQRADLVAMVTARDPKSGEWMLVVERGSAAAFEVGAWFKALAASLGGRGGGQPQRAEGRFPAQVELQEHLKI